MSRLHILALSALVSTAPLFSGCSKKPAPGTTAAPRRRLHRPMLARSFARSASLAIAAAMPPVCSRLGPPIVNGHEVRAL